MDLITYEMIIDKVNKAKIHSMLDFPLVEGDVSKTRCVVTTEVKTAATDGNTLWVNPHFFNALDKYQAEFVILHEWAHAFLKHFSRSMNMSDSELVARASDEEANHLLRKAGVQILPNAFCTKQFEDMTMEDIYRYLESQKQNGDDGKDTQPNEDEQSGSESGDSGDSTTETNDGAEPEAMSEGDSIAPVENYELPPVCEWGEVKEIGDPSAEDRAQAEFEDTIRQENCIASASLNGKLPKAIESYVRSINARSKVDWKSELSDFVEQAMSGFDGYISWSKPNKRYASMGIHMPSIIPESEEIAILVDSSGSMEENMFNLAMNETKAVIDLAQPTMSHVVTFSHYIVSTESYEGGVEFPEKIDRLSNGGTDIQMALDYVSSNFDVNGIIVLSDMEFYGVPSDPGVPIIWVEIPSGLPSYYMWKPTFGRAIRVSV
jgi:predicted metal-dependent peptidase